MSWITLDVDIDIDEFLSNCNKKDIEYIIECLVEDGHLDKKVLKPKKIVSSDEDWNLAIEKIKNRKYLLTNDEEKAILEITQRLPD